MTHLNTAINLTPAQRNALHMLYLDARREVEDGDFGNLPVAAVLAQDGALKGTMVMPEHKRAVAVLVKKELAVTRVDEATGITYALPKRANACCVALACARISRSFDGLSPLKQRVIDEINKAAWLWVPMLEGNTLKLDNDLSPETVGEDTFKADLIQWVTKQDDLVLEFITGIDRDGETRVRWMDTLNDHPVMTQGMEYSHTCEWWKPEMLVAAYMNGATSAKRISYLLACHDRAVVNIMAERRAWSNSSYKAETFWTNADVVRFNKYACPKIRVTN